MRTLTAIRYVTPLREGGSLPAIVEGDDGALHVLKFRGAGQGPRALVAEWIVGELARASGFRVPALSLMQVEPPLGRNEPDPEIQDLLKASVGSNLALAYLPGAIAYDPIAPPAIAPELAADLVWLDAFVMNVDRTARNPNLLLWEGALWLIDHGAALYFHHAWASAAASAASAFPQVAEHILLPQAGDMGAADARMRARLAALDVTAILAALPDAWLLPDPAVGDAAAQRAAYARFFAQRLAAPARFVEEAARARALLV